MKAIVITLFGMILGPAVIVICLFVIIHGVMAGEALDGGGWAVVGIFGGLASIIVLIGLNAWNQDRKHAPAGAGPRVTRVVPILMILGVLVGLGLGWWWSKTRLEGIALGDEINCQRVFPDQTPPLACLEVSRACRHSDLDLKEVDFPHGVAPKGVWPSHLHQPSLLESRAEMLCIYREMVQGKEKKEK